MAPNQRKNRRDFAALLASSSLAIAVVVVIWAATGAGSFWPIWVIFGLGVALTLSAWRAFGPLAEDPPPQRRQEDMTTGAKAQRRHGDGDD